MYTDDRCIAICDSGIGGLSVLRKSEVKWQGENFVYFADYDNMPYGNKSDDKLVEIALKNVKKLLAFSPKVIIFACNTLSTVAIRELPKFSIPIIGVFPKIENEGKGALLCTVRTARSDYVKLLRQKNPNLEILPQETLASKIEKLYCDGESFNLKDCLSVLNGEYDFISLGCTHYSLVDHFIKNIVPNSRVISGENEIFEKKVFLKSTFAHQKNESKIAFVGMGNERTKRVYNLLKTLEN